MQNSYEIIWIESTASTNDLARAQIHNTDNMTVIAAERQTSGRGQRGNSWNSAPGKNLTFSIILKFQEFLSDNAVMAYDQSVISQMTALSVIDLLATHGIDAKVKWPNDIYVGNLKICGILIENSITGKWLSTSIIGIGLNVNQTEFDPTLPNPTSILNENGTQTDHHLLLEEFMDIFCGYCRRYLNGKGGYARLRKLYHAQLWKLGEPSEFYDYTTLPEGHLTGPSTDVHEDAERFTGIICGVSDTGNLLVEKNEGELKEFAFKEIGYIF